MLLRLLCNSSLVVASVALFALQTGCCKKEKPNVLIILLDDAGYADFGFMGSKDLVTPNIDSLALDGVVCTDAHVTASVSSPSRAGILTGRYQQRFGHECNPPDNNYGVDINEKMVTSYFKDEGYATASIGKWHLGEREGMHPIERGVDFFYGFLGGGRGYFYDINGDDMPKRTKSYLQFNGQRVSFEGKYLTDDLTDKTIEFIDENRDKSFFIYYAPNAVHTPMHATEEDLALFEGHERQKLAAMTYNVDKNIGRIVTTLKKHGIYDNTLIFFLSDNGGATTNTSSNLPLKGFKGNEFEGGHRVPFVVCWKGKILSGGNYEGLCSALDIAATSLVAAGISVSNDKPLDGVNLVPFINDNKNRDAHETLFWRKNEMSAMRRGKMKMIAAQMSDSVESKIIALYNLENDLNELDNLAENQQLKTSMTDLYNNWETGLIEPLWLEGSKWPEITYNIHKRLIENQQYTSRKNEIFTQKKLTKSE